MTDDEPLEVYQERKLLGIVRNCGTETIKKRMARRVVFIPERPEVTLSVGEVAELGDPGGPSYRVIQDDQEFLWLTRVFV